MQNCPVLINPALLKVLFPQYTPQTIDRWCSRGDRGAKLPAPDMMMGHVKVWTLETVLSWAGERNKVPDSVALELICHQQVLG